MRVASSYEGYKYDETKAFEKNGKLYVTVETPCDRCSGKGIIIARVHNGKPIPVQPDGGICYACEGTKIFRKDVRLYTDKEFEQMEKAKAKAAEKRAIEREKKMKAEFASKRAKWLEKNGFNENEETFIYFPADSYDIKEDLKEAGFRFSSFLLWHTPSIPEGYEDKVISMKMTDVAEMGAWGSANYFSDARSKVDSAVKNARPQREVDSQWLGEIGERLKDLEVQLTGVHGFNGQWGWSQIVSFETTNGNILKWFTAKDMSAYEIGDSLILSGTVKNQIEDQYEDNQRVTILTRCRIK